MRPRKATDSEIYFMKIRWGYRRKHFHFSHKSQPFWDCRTDLFHVLSLLDYKRRQDSTWAYILATGAFLLGMAIGGFLNR